MQPKPRKEFVFGNTPDFFVDFCLKSRRVKTWALGLMALNSNLTFTRIHYLSCNKSPDGLSSCFLP